MYSFHVLLFCAEMELERNSSDEDWMAVAGVFFSYARGLVLFHWDARTPESFGSAV